MPPKSLAEYLAISPETVEVLRSYRKAALAERADDARELQRLRGKKSAERYIASTQWTDFLFNDFSVAGPRSVPGFDRREWPLLQALRNSGCAFNNADAEFDAILDQQPASQPASQPEATR